MSNWQKLAATHWNVVPFGDAPAKLGVAAADQNGFSHVQGIRKAQQKFPKLDRSPVENSSDT
jgi:hypothetical protein